MSTRIIEQIPVEAGVILEAASQEAGSQGQNIRSGGLYKPRGNQMSLKYFNDHFKS